MRMYADPLWYVKPGTSDTATLPSGWDVEIPDDLTVLGSMLSSDPYIELNEDASGAPTENGGVLVNRGTSDHALVGWDESADAWKLGLTPDTPDGGTPVASMTSWFTFSAGQVLAPDGSAAAPSFAYSTDASTGWWLDGAGNLGASANGTYSVVVTQTRLTLSSAHYLSWSSGQPRTGSIDVQLHRDSADTLALRRGTNAQNYRIYNTYTDASNYERGTFGWSGNILYVGTGNAGTGSARSMILVASGNQWTLSGTDGSLAPNVTNTQNIGSTGNQVKNLYLGTGLAIGSGGTAAAAKRLAIFNTDDGANYEWGGFTWSSNVFKAGTSNAGSGSARDFDFITNGTTRWTLGGSTGHLTASGAYNITTTGTVTGLNFVTTGNTPKIQFYENDAAANNAKWDFAVGSEIFYGRLWDDAEGSSSAWLAINRTANTCDSIAFTATAMTTSGSFALGAGSTFSFLGRSAITSSSDGVLILSNNAINDFSLLRFGGTTSAFPALKRSNTNLLVQCADDSALTNIAAASVWAGLSGWAAAGQVRLANAGSINARNNGNTADITIASTTSGDVVLLARSGGGTGYDCLIGSPSSKFGVFGTTPAAQPAHIADPAGGATVDAEARTAINAINAAMATLGLTAAS